MDPVPSIIAMAVCLLLSAFFSAAETAFSSLNKARLKALAEKGNDKAQLALRLSENYDKLISTILIGNNIVNIALATIGTVMFVQLIGDFDKATAVSMAAVTALVLIFGEITPKNIANDRPERIAMFSAPLINVMIVLLTPLTFIFSLWKSLVSKIFKSDDEQAMSQEELLFLLDEVQQEGGIDESEGELLKNAIEFGDLQAQDILTHRVDLEAVDVEATYEEVGAKFTETRYSRLLVYEETIDRIVGVIHQKDFYVGTGVSTRSIRDIMTPPVFIHQTEKVDDLLELLQSTKSHMAIVVDEYGGTLGVVTMEDILEELVGEIWDEHDEVEEPICKLADDRYMVDCALTLDDFCDRFEIENKSESVSVGGWVMEQMQRIPQEGEGFEYEHLTVTVKRTDDHRVEKIEVVVGLRATEDEE